MARRRAVDSGTGPGAQRGVLRTGARTAVLESVAGWVPGEPVGNDQLPAAWGVDDSWVRTRTGIGSRHRAGPGLATGDVAFEAAGRLLGRYPVPGPVDALVLATATPDHLCPGTAPALAARLGLGTVPALDIAAVCSGFVYGLAVCHGLVASGLYERVLLVGADVYSAWLDPADRSAGVVFGDGAGAALVAAGRTGAPGELLAFDLGSDGTGYDLITVPGGGARARSTDRPAAAGDEFFRMQGPTVYQHAVQRMTGSCRELLTRVGWDAAEVDHFVPHQANARILRAVAERVGIGPQRCVTHLERVGNTGAASIPLALADAEGRGRLRAGDRILITAFGGGLTWGSAALRWPGTPQTISMEGTQNGAVR
ncbi:beta-ketoacyl-ACP synthase 3 [Streptomyces sp. NBC_00654]|uniref:beta-ketoacyl-ACP synthase 3 n=1 Tax=Streptomyces sp. NBC_00654 TaxID=2975799 RepID=UPI002254B240|nr:beta-ketoacyl-ACP synthase 3 [Streptomyces sp. NBC_00654]MCX4967754.1 beta-ketoacyl-ACP synthase 3 [Streptomyces sp. NBC_00654]